MTSSRPPRFFLRFFRRFCHPDLVDYIEGDLMELYEERVRKKGKRSADVKFMTDVLLLFRPGIIRPHGSSYQTNQIAMFKNYIKITWRNLSRHKGYAAINIAGFSLGIAVCIVILLFVRYEKSFDSMHRKNIYRLNEVQNFPGMLAAQKVALSMFPMGPTMSDEFPEILNFTRINGFGNYPVYYGEKKVFMGRSLFVDSAFLELFDFRLLSGNRHTALDMPNCVVLTRSASRKIFGDPDGLNRTLTIYDDDTINLKVTGILEDIPQHSHLQFEALCSFSTITKPDWSENWGNNWLNTYFELAPGTDVAVLEQKFPAYLNRHMPAEQAKFYTLFLLPLSEVHDGASDIGLDGNNYQKFDGKYTDIFLVLALVILMIACINFVNLSTARSAERAREVGIRKTIGSHRWQLGIQFITESVVLSLIAMILSVALVFLILPGARELSQRHLTFPLFTNVPMTASLIGGSILIGIFSGLYPAVYLSSFRPVAVLKGSVQSARQSSAFRNMLVVVQFSSAIFLMINTVFAVRQLRFMESADPGYSRARVVDIPLTGESGRKYETLKQQLLENSLIEGVTAAQDILGSHLDQSGVTFKGDGPRRDLTATRLIVDPDYLDLYHIQLAEGENFSSDPSANGKQYIINETLARELLADNLQMPMSSLIGTQFGFDTLGTIVGIARDFNFNSLHSRIETLFLYNQKDWGFRHMSVKINPGRTTEALAYIKSIWENNCNDQPFDYVFLDDHFSEVYRADTQVNRTLSLLTLLAFIISCLGMFGLASYSAEQRRREVGIRKVLGASVGNIVGMLSKDFLKFVMIASVIALPLAWMAVHQWLQLYAYRIPVNAGIFVMVAVAALFIAFITTSYQAVRAASINPVNSLRTE